MTTDNPKHRPLDPMEQAEGPPEEVSNVATFTVVMGAIVAILLIVVIGIWFFLYNTTQN